MTMFRTARIASIVGVLGLCLLLQAHSAGVSRAQTVSTPTVTFQALSGHDSWGSYTVSYSGFGDDEALDFTFTAPNGTQAQVNGQSIFYASTEDDGSGTFPFSTTLYNLSPSSSGTWTVHVVGETSGLTASTTFTWYGDDD